MTKNDEKKQLAAVSSLFLLKKVKRMKDIETLYPTLIVKRLGINHSRYIGKLYKPEGFTIIHILELSSILEISPHFIIDVILKETSSKIKK